MHVVGGEPIDGRLRLRGRRCRGEEQFGTGRHVLDDLGDGNTVTIAHRRVDLSADAQLLGQVRAELVSGVGHRTVLGGFHTAEVEEVDDADTGAPVMPACLPRVSRW